MYAATGQDEINFATFCFAVITYNRWFMYANTLGTGKVEYNLGQQKVSMQLDEFLAMMHDSLLPDYVRKSVDNIRVNIPDDQLAFAMQKLL